MIGTTRKDEGRAPRVGRVAEHLTRLLLEEGMPGTVARELGERRARMWVERQLALAPGDGSRPPPRPG